MDIGFTGTQRGMTTAQAEVVWEKLQSLTASPWTHQGLSRTVTTHSGDCIGADKEFFIMCLDFGFFNVGHPPINPSKRAWCEFNYLWEEKEYLERNRDIVRCSSLLIATPGEMTEQLRSGTWSTIRFARKIGIPVYIVYPDGTVEED